MTCFRGRDADLRQDGGGQPWFHHTGSLWPGYNREYAADAANVLQKTPPCPQIEKPNDRNGLWHLTPLPGCPGALCL